MVKEKVAAFAAYLFSIVGAMCVLLTHRNDSFAGYHAKQSLGIGIFAIGALPAWFVIVWFLAWIPYPGFILGIALFALVIALYLVLLVACIFGMINALTAKQRPVPVVGAYASQVSAFIVKKIGHEPTLDKEKR